MLAFVLTLPVIHNHVHVLWWLGAKLAEHGCDLSAMIAAVIHHVLQHFPKRVGSDRATKILVLDHPLDSSWTQLAHELADFGFEIRPFHARRGDIGNALRFLKPHRLTTPPARDPD